MERIDEENLNMLKKSVDNMIRILQELLNHATREDANGFNQRRMVDALVAHLKCSEAIIELQQDTLGLVQEHLKSQKDLGFTQFASSKPPTPEMMEKIHAAVKGVLEAEGVAVPAH